MIDYQNLPTSPKTAVDEAQLEIAAKMNDLFRSDEPYANWGWEPEFAEGKFEEWVDHLGLGKKS